MLTADLVRVWRREGRLYVRELKPDARARALVLAGAYLSVAATHVGRSQDTFDAACAGVEVPARDRRLADGLLKLVRDRCDFGTVADLDPVDLRRRVFHVASAARQRLGTGESFQREAILAAVATELGLEAGALDALLFADLKGAQRLASVKPIGAEALVRAYERGQVQAVLLKAVRVRVEVSAREPAALRRLFARLKFLRLLPVISRGEGGAFVIDVDGPMSLFGPVTKYGLQLAQMVPALDASGPWRLRADVRWGRAREPLIFEAVGGGDAGEGGDDPRALLAGGGTGLGYATAATRSGQEDPILSEDAALLWMRFRELETGWEVAPAQEVLDLPGVGICVPDLTFTRRETGARVHLEVLGFWSREAVWRRVDLVQAGLPQPVLFAASERLRVSEDVLPADLPGALYVYKGVMNARRVLERLDTLLPGG